MASHKNRKVFFVIPYPLDSAPGQRFRFEQYLPVLRENGIETCIYPFLTNETNRILYQRGFYVRKISGVLMGLARRIIMLTSLPSANAVFIFREAAPFGPPVFEWIILNIFRKKIIYDFDDSIWLTDRKDESKLLRILKWRSKVAYICKHSHLISCGNEYLASFSRMFNKNIKIIPTTIDTDTYLPSCRTHTDKIIIGWSGSVTTIEHFITALPVLTKLKNKYGDKIGFKIIGSGEFEYQELNIRGIPWRRESELADLSEISIGIMPLPDDPWTRGKCGLKGLQYMALEIPTVMSSVGVNQEIIQDGVNGFIGFSEETWVEKISLLIESQELRIRMGKSGRKTVEERFSLKSQQVNYLSMFEL